MCPCSSRKPRFRESPFFRFVPTTYQQISTGNWFLVLVRVDLRTYYYLGIPKYIPDTYNPYPYCCVTHKMINYVGTYTYVDTKGCASSILNRCLIDLHCVRVIRYILVHTYSYYNRLWVFFKKFVRYLFVFTYLFSYFNPFSVRVFTRDERKSKNHFCRS